MGFWGFMRDMSVFDWLFGHSKKEYFWEHNRKVVGFSGVESLTFSWFADNLRGNGFYER